MKVMRAERWCREDGGSKHLWNVVNLYDTTQHSIIQDNVFMIVQVRTWNLPFLLSVPQQVLNPRPFEYWIKSYIYIYTYIYIYIHLPILVKCCRSSSAFYTFHKITIKFSVSYTSDWLTFTSVNVPITHHDSATLHMYAQITLRLPPVGSVLFDCHL
jgi:hypothetical protein